MLLLFVALTTAASAEPDCFARANIAANNPQPRGFWVPPPKSRNNQSKAIGCKSRAEMDSTCLCGLRHRMRQEESDDVAGRVDRNPGCPGDAITFHIFEQRPAVLVRVQADGNLGRYLTQQGKIA